MISPSIAALLGQIHSPPQIRLTEAEKDYLRPICEFRNSFERDEKRVVVFGAFKAGKSSLLNAWLGSTWLPSRSYRATGVPTLIYHHPVASAWISQKSDGAAPHHQLIPLDQLNQYVLLGTYSQSASDISEQMHSVRLGLPVPILQNQWSLVDTPGLLDDAALSQVTQEQLEQADLAIAVLLAKKLLSGAERDAIVRVNSLLKGNLIVIVNQIDQIDPDEREQVIEWATSNLKGIGNGLVGNSVVFALSAKSWLKGKEPESFEAREAFRLYMPMLFQQQMGERVAIVSRLAILEYRLKEAIAYFKVRYHTLCQKINALESEAHASLQQKQLKFDEHMGKIYEKLSLFRTTSGIKVEQIKTDVSAELANWISANDPQWFEKTIESLNLKAELLSNEFESSIDVILGCIQIDKPTMDKTSGATQSQGSYKADLATAIGKASGSSTLLGFSRFVGKAVGLDLQKENEKSGRSLIQENVAGFSQRLDRYFDNLFNSLEAFRMAHKPRLEINDALKTCYRIRKDYEQLLEWLSSCFTRIQPIVEETMNLRSQFDDRWNEFVSLVEDAVTRQIDENKNNPDLKQITNRAIGEVIAKRWEDKDSYNYAWLSKLNRDYQGLGSALLEVVRTTRIGKNLKRIKLVDFKELTLIVSSVVAVAVVMLWGQNLQSIREYELSWKQLSASAGIVCVCYYLTSHFKKMRQKKHEELFKQVLHGELDFYKSKAIVVLEQATAQEVS